MWLVMLLFGVPSAFRTPVAGALVLAWIFGEFVVAMSGDNLPLMAYALSNTFVILIILFHSARDCQPYCTFRHQLWAGMWLERYAEDRVLLWLFPVLWALYLAPLDDYYKWWSLYYIILFRFLLVGAVTAKVAACWLRARLTASQSPPAGLQLQALWGRLGYG